MAKLFDFSNYREEPDMDSMDEAALRSYLKELQEQIAALDEEEPANMESEEYELWGEAHENLEDLVDEVMDRLDDLR